MQTMTEQEITELAAAAIEAARLDKDVDGSGWTRCDAVCLPIQERLGVESGDLAGLLWSGCEDEWDSLPAVERYIRAELNWQVERVQRVTDEMYEMLQSETQDEEMFLGVVYAGGAVLMGETVQAADQDYVRITDGSCEHQELIPLADCLQATDLKPLIAPVLSWYVEAA